MRFVVGYVPDHRGKEAMNLAVTLAGAREASLDVVVVLPSDEPTFDMYSPDRAFNSALEEQGREWLDRAMSHVPEGVTAVGQIRHHESITEGLIEAAIDPAAGPEAEAIIVGASHRGILGQLKIGSVAAALLHSAPVPVALAPSGYEAHPAVTRITCAVGERRGDDAMVEVAIAAAATRGVPLRLMSLLALDDDVDDSRAARLSAAERHKEALVERAKGELSETVLVTGVVGTGRNFEECVTSLDFEPSEIVLLGSSRLGGPKRVFLGASAHRISRALPVPMVVVPREHQTP